MTNSERLEKDKLEIDRFLKKSNIKEVNRMDYSKELTEAMQLMAIHPAPKEEVDTYVNDYTTLALSLLEEPLSDIPMGQTIQFLKLVNREYNIFKNICNNKQNPMDICQQFWKLNAVSEYLNDIIMKLSDKEEFVETPELNNIEIEFIETKRNCEMDTYINAIEETLGYYDAVIKLLNKGIEKNDIALMSVTVFYLSTANLYLHYTIEYMEEESKKASV